MGDLRRAKIGDLCVIEKGSTGLASAIAGKYPLVATGADRKTSSGYQFDAKAVCIPLVSSTGHGKKTLNYVHYQEGKFALGTILAAVIPKDERIIDPRYLHIYLQKNKDRVIVPLMKGAANVSLSISSIASIEIPLPPIQKQQALLAKIDSISTEHSDLDNQLDRQTELFAQLRQSVLHEAIEGKLTSEWRKRNPHLISGENHASNLLERIQSEKEQFVEEGKIRKEKPLPPIRADEGLFDLPEGWVWSRLGICSINRDDARIPISRIERERKDKKYPYYGASGIIDRIDGFTHEGRNLLIGEDGANLLSRSTPIAFIADGQYWVNNHAHVIGFIHDVTLSYCEIYVNAIDLKPYVTGGFQPKLSQGNLNLIPIAFPSIAEQKVIVERVSSIMATIRGLETQTFCIRKQSDSLMESIMREAFEQSHT